MDPILDDTEWSVCYLQARREVGFTAAPAVFTARFEELLAETRYAKVMGEAEKIYRSAFRVVAK